MELSDDVVHVAVGEASEDESHGFKAIGVDKTDE